MHIGIILTSLSIFCLVSADPVLRYNESSCNSLEPVYVEENWQRGVATSNMGEEEDSGLFNTPKRSFQRVPPFQIQVDFDQYRRNRRYKGWYPPDKLITHFNTFLFCSSHHSVTESEL